MMYGGLRMPGGYLELLSKYGVGVTIEKVNGITIPKYSGVYNYTYANTIK